MSFYDMYPDYTSEDVDRDDRDGVFVCREASETGGLGHPTDYGQDMDDFMWAAREARRSGADPEALAKAMSKLVMPMQSPVQQSFERRG
jgi:hypothetical protein